MKLIIVESPTKARTISHFLSNEFQVESSNGHIRDLPKAKLGINEKRDFKPTYVILAKAKKRVNELKKLAEKSDKIILATDEDREGEAIAWHLIQVLDLGKTTRKSNNKSTKSVERIVFHEITKKAIEEALKNPRGIDENLVDAQQARRILDRLVGYKLSPFLWKKIRYGLSAGRVQSAAVKLIVDREREIEKFTPEEYWTIEVELQKLKSLNKFEAELIKINDKKLEKFDIKTKDEADKIVKDISVADFTVSKIEKRETKKSPLPPFTTSTLQQTANQRFGYTAKKTMRAAQKLYENGQITYMRTDSVNLSEESLRAAKELISNNFGEKYHKFRKYQTKSKSAQEAHEAIRPSNPSKNPNLIKGEIEESSEYKIYELIWRRFIASQMADAIFDSQTIEINAASKNLNYVLKTSGQTLKFDGFLKIYPTKTKEVDLPKMTEDEKLELLKINPLQHFTEPPPRYNEASLIKTLEEYGIGRPSTYAPIISTIQERDYAKKEEKVFKPSEIGFLVTDMLSEHFPEIVDVKFTAKMEDNLDEIANGKIGWAPIIKEFYNPFNSRLESKYKEVEKLQEATDKICPEDNGKIIIKYGRFGKFYACENYPECKHTEPMEEEKKMQEKYGGEPCEKCNSPMVVKRGKFGIFLGCSNYPKCKNIKKIEKILGLKCPKCQKGEIVEKRTRKGRIFYGCASWPKCDWASWSKPK